MTRILAIQPTQYPPVQVQPSYNAVKIRVNAPVDMDLANQQNQAETTSAIPVYNSIPTASAYAMPQKSVYQVQDNNQAAAHVPPPVIVQPVVNKKQASELTFTSEKKSDTVKPTEVKTSETAVPKLDLNKFISKLTSPKYQDQVDAMQAIAYAVQADPKQATQLLDVKIFNALLGILNKDSSKLEGPTPRQLQLKEKIMNGGKPTEAEMAEANKVTPMELAERNKLYALVVAFPALQKLYISEMEKKFNGIVPLTELPGATAIVEQLRKNPNPLIKIGCMNDLIEIRRPEYKQDLKTIFSVVKNDKNEYVRKAATEALILLEKVADPKPPKQTKETQKAA